LHSMSAILAQIVPEGRVFGLDLQTLISIGIQLLNGMILAAALSFILYKPVKEFMRKRTERIQSKMDDADATMDKANELIAEYDRKLTEIDKERMVILEAARLKAADQRKTILEEAKREADELRKRSVASIAEDRERLKEEARFYIIELASLMANKYIRQNIDDKTQDKLFEEAVAQLEGAQWQS